jgi:MFS family permease
MKKFYLRAIITASLGGILYGYDMGVISGSLPLLSLYFNLTPSEEDWIVSLLYFGGGVGAATGGFICDWLGRKFAILITDVSGCVLRSLIGNAFLFSFLPSTKLSAP